MDDATMRRSVTLCAECPCFDDGCMCGLGYEQDDVMTPNGRHVTASFECSLEFIRCREGDIAPVRGQVRQDPGIACWEIVENAEP